VSFPGVSGPGTSSGGSRMGGGGGSATKPVDPYMVIAWSPELLQVRTVTGEAAPKADEAPAKDAPATEKPADAKEKEPLLRLRGLSSGRGGDDRPVLVYLHWPHEDGARGKETLKACTGPMDDAALIRASFLFRCVEINTRDSEARLLEEAKAPAAPGLLVCRPDGTVVWRGDARAMAGKALAAALVEVVRREFPAKGKEIDAELKAQPEKLKEAQVLAARGTFEEARDLVQRVVDSPVRIGAAWEAARALLKKLEAAQAKAEEAAK
jgi:hypothetical protein